jgi:hypothetical protein
LAPDLRAIAQSLQDRMDELTLKLGVEEAA